MEQSTTSTKKRAEHLGPARRRPQILDGALKLFLEHGYDGTSMQAVASASGVTKPVIYAAFDSKDALFRALLEREEQRIMGDISGGFAGVDLEDPEKTLVGGFTAFLSAVAASPEVYRLVFLQEGGGNAAVAERIHAGREHLGRHSVLLGQVHDGLAEAGARLVLAEVDPWSPEDAGATLGNLAARSAAEL
jgi:AcrR family transcriptional regulator